MTAFRYKALNDEGKLVKGVLEGDSDRQVRGTLRQRHLRPVEVAEATNVGGAGEGRRLPWFAKRLGAGEGDIRGLLEKMLVAAPRIENEPELIVFPSDKRHAIAAGD